MNALLKTEATSAVVDAFNTPVLLIIFNRPEKTRSVFEAIKKQKPRYLYVAADGPRPGNTDDIEKCKAARGVIQVDWDCDLHTLYRDENRGCGRGPAEAISWFFENVDEGIILEDDCLPVAYFFYYCQQLLHHFRTDEHMFVVSGTNPVIKWKSGKSSYTITKYAGTWGWATWKRAWLKFDHSIKEWETSEGKAKVRQFLNSERHYRVFNDIFETFSNPIRQIDVWDYQWFFTRFVSGGYSIVPGKNLISNIGFGDEANHTIYKDDKLSGLTSFEQNDPIVFRKSKPDKIYDWYIFERIINPQKRSTVKKIVLKILKFLYS